MTRKSYAVASGVLMNPRRPAAAAAPSPLLGRTQPLRLRRWQRRFEGAAIAPRTQGDALAPPFAATLRGSHRTGGRKRVIVSAMRVFVALLVAIGIGFASPVPAAAVRLDEMSSPEVRDAIRGGTRTVIIPVGGVEQNGPHMALGKHDFRVRALAARIAVELGNALVAPVVSYVPEGNVSPPSEHMRFAGTISISEAAFKGVLVGAARSLRQHGFTHIVLIGDSGNYQPALKAVADELNREWRGGPARVHFIAAYYAAAQGPFHDLLRASGLSDAQIGNHAGAADTALLMAVDATHVWPQKMTPDNANASGVTGDPTRASAELGKSGLDLIVKRSVAAIRAATAATR
jgi:creatinine amidohydrolase/Fe(II)-dependent formamide hydrolase-like protein